MKLIIIAAGQGSRLRSITDGTPKSLSKIHGNTIIDTLLYNCKINNIKDIVIVITNSKRARFNSLIVNKNNNFLKVFILYW